MQREIAVIRRAREIISDPEKWTQGAEARDANNKPVDFFSSRACKHCAWGAMLVAARELVGPRTPEVFALVDRSAELLDPSVKAYGIHVIAYINDNEGHAAVLALFDKALASETAS